MKCPEAGAGEGELCGRAAEGRVTGSLGVLHFHPAHTGRLSPRTLQLYVPIRQFFYDLIHPDYSAVTDVYVLMFLADTVDFVIIVFGFWAFGVGGGPRPPHRGDERCCPVGASRTEPAVSSPETLGCGRHHVLTVRGPGAGALLGDGAHSVWDHGGGPGALPQEDCPRKGHLPGHPGVWDSLLDVLHPAWRDREVRPWELELWGHFPGTHRGRKCFVRISA